MRRDEKFEGPAMTAELSPLDRGAPGPVVFAEIRIRAGTQEPGDPADVSPSRRLHQALLQLLTPAPVHAPPNLTR
jgi:hypothetical protein